MGINFSSKKIPDYLTVSSSPFSIFLTDCRTIFRPPSWANTLYNKFEQQTKNLENFSFFLLFRCIEGWEGSCE
jgi:hypothetical protein